MKCERKPNLGPDMFTSRKDERMITPSSSTVLMYMMMRTSYIRPSDDAGPCSWPFLSETEAHPQVPG